MKISSKMNYLFDELLKKVKDLEFRIRLIIVAARVLCLFERGFLILLLGGIKIFRLNFRFVDPIF